MQYKITNVENSKEYVVDTNEIGMTVEEWVVGKPVYGENPTIEEIAIDIVPLIKEAHGKCLAHVEDNFADAAGLLQIDRLSRQFPDNSTLQTMINDCDAWCASVWQHYRSYKDNLVAGTPIDLDLNSLGNPPHKFFDIIDTAGV